ncbi:MAG: PAS domain-containing sensor histidine kinase [candidate division Zixibacteria bacterium]|nr:PAS domain-containing sensor histidine kinase [candidate division Zixibacteria bacterium]
MESTHKTYFDSMPCFVSVQDRDLRIVDANKRFHDEFGDVDGRFCYQVYKQRPEQCEDCPVVRTFRDGNPHRSEQLVRTLDGREVSVIVYTTPIRDDNGDITRVMEMSTDITEIKQLQHQLRDSQERYRMLFEEVPCFISIQDRDLRIVEANRLHREAFGTYYGCQCYKVYKHREKECSPCVVRSTFEDQAVHHHEEVVTKRDGDRMNVMVTTAPVRDADGNVNSVIEMSTDITQIRQLQSKLSSVGMIISTISHDLKGLLNGMDGGIYLVNTGLKKDDQERTAQGWEMVLRNVDRIRSTVLDILYYAKDRDPDWEETRTRAIVDEVFDLMQSKAVDHNIEFTREYVTADGHFEADARALRSMLVNLVDNSFDACRLDRKKESHNVSITATGKPDAVEFRIADNGIGMTRDVREKAFTLFFSSKGSGGTGLGLFIANKIAQSHGGSITLESEPDVGTTFVVMIPRKRLAVTTDPAGEDGAPEAGLNL